MSPFLADVASHKQGVRSCNDILMQFELDKYSRKPKMKSLQDVSITLSCKKNLWTYPVLPLRPAIWDSQECEEIQ